MSKFFSSTISNILTQNITNSFDYSYSSTGSGLSSSTANGNTLNETNNLGTSEANLNATRIANQLINNYQPNDKAEPFLFSTSTTIINTINLTNQENSIQSDITQGVIYNINNFFSIVEYLLTKTANSQLDNYGANKDINYYAGVYPGITPLSEFNPFPTFYLGANDYILYEVVVPDISWLKNHNYFSFTPYFYNYIYDSENNLSTDVFASTDITIPFFKLFKSSGSKINICLTASKTIGELFEKQGFLISKIPSEYLETANLLPLFRVGLYNNFSFNINNFVTTKYYKGSSQLNGLYYTSEEIEASLPTTLLPINNPTYELNLSIFNSAVEYLQTISTSSTQAQPYFSNTYNTDYGFNSFYTSITVTPPAELQANNTGEAYFNTKSIDLTTLTTPFFYVLTLNQKLMDVALTSNVQIYNRDNNAIIYNGEIVSSSPLPLFSNPNYPYIKNDDITFPLLQINTYQVSDLIAQNITSIIIVERIEFNPINFYQSSFNYPGSTYVFFANELTMEEISFLTSQYGTNIRITEN